MRVAKLAPMTGKIGEEMERFFDRFTTPGFLTEPFIPPFPYETATTEWYPVLDLTAAIVQFRLRGARPIRIMQSIAAGLLGREAYQGGTATATLGVALHFLIAFTAATVYYLASRKLAFLRARPFLSGVLYGVAVYFFMNYVVLPLSRFPRGSFNLENLITGILIHMLCVGLPIAYAVQRYADKAVIKN